MNYLLLFLIVLGVALLLWCLLGILLVPVFDQEMITICRAKNNGAFLEYRVRGYGWLRDGRLTGGRLIIADCGLTDEGLEIAGRLCEQYDWVSYYKGALPSWILEMQDDAGE